MSPPQTHKCGLCPLAFETKAELRVHSTNEHNGYQAKCDKCGAEFRFNYFLMKHLTNGCKGSESSDDDQDRASSNQAPGLLIPLPPAVNESTESEPDIIESSQPATTSRKRALALVVYSDTDEESNHDAIETSGDNFQPTERDLEASSDDTEKDTVVQGKFFCSNYRLTIMPLTYIIPIYRKDQEI